MKLAIAQMTLGLLIIGSLFAFAVWIEPGFYRMPILNEAGIVTGVAFFNPGRNISMMSWMTVYLALGLAVLGCGITQYLKARAK